ncbi:MAG: tetratricopeptide repeat protein, partial [Nostoc sp. TH1S01]|nr:tetratricopeptide repeat protein [Nostoc sp. TH1S01]
NAKLYLAPVIELYHHMVRSGQYDEAFELFRDRLHDLTYFQLGAYQLQIDLLLALFPKGENDLPQLTSESDQAWMLNSLANSYSLSGQPRKAVPLFEQSVAIHEKLEDKINLAITLGNLACIAQLPIGSLQAAESNLRRAIALCQEIEEEYDEAIGHKELGRVLTYRGEWAEAEAELSIALALFEKEKNIPSQGLVWAYRALRSLLLLRTLTNQTQRHPEIATALAAAKRALELAEETAHTEFPYAQYFIQAYWLLGAAERVNGNLNESDTHLNEALTRCRAINLVYHEADILLDLARLRVEQNQQDIALELAQEALAITERCGYVLQGADVHLFLAEQARLQNKRDEALRYAREARRLATCDGGKYTYKVAYNEAAALLRLLGESYYA